MADAVMDGERASASERTRELILDAARVCVLRFGIRRTSIQDVARVAGVSRGSVYRYFSDKPSLIDAVVARSSERNMAECGALVAGQRTLERQVAEVAVWLRAKAVRDLFFQLDETEPETLAIMLTTRSQPMVAAWIEFWRPHVLVARRAGELSKSINVNHACEWITRVLLGLVVGDAVTFDADDPRQLRAYVKRFVVRGMA